MPLLPRLTVRLCLPDYFHDVFGQLLLFMLSLLYGELSSLEGSKKNLPQGVRESRREFEVFEGAVHELVHEKSLADVDTLGGKSLCFFIESDSIAHKLLATPSFFEFSFFLYCRRRLQKTQEMVIKNFKPLGTLMLPGRKI